MSSAGDARRGARAIVAGSGRNMGKPVNESLDVLLAEIRACRRCVVAPDGQALPHEPRPVLIASPTARIGVAGQAPGTRVHASGIPFSDPSGKRLLEGCSALVK